MLVCITVFTITTIVHTVFMCRHNNAIINLHERLDNVEYRDIISRTNPLYLDDLPVAVAITDPV